MTWHVTRLSADKFRWEVRAGRMLLKTGCAGTRRAASLQAIGWMDTIQPPRNNKR